MTLLSLKKAKSKAINKVYLINFQTKYILYLGMESFHEGSEVIKFVILPILQQAQNDTYLLHSYL